MYRTLTALTGAALLLGASVAQAEEVALSDTQMDEVIAGSGQPGGVADVSGGAPGGVIGSLQRLTVTPNKP